MHCARKFQQCFLLCLCSTMSWQLGINCTEDDDSGAAVSIVLSICLTHFLSMWLTQELTADCSEYDRGGGMWDHSSTSVHDTRVVDTCQPMDAAGGVGAQHGRERKSLVFKWTSSITNTWDVTKTWKKSVCKSAHNFWCSSRVHRIREHKLPRSRFSDTSLF